MSVNRRILDIRMEPSPIHPITEFTRQKADDSEENDFPRQPSRLRIVLSRAALVYLGLFLGLSTFLSMLGVDPLIHNGALPKFLLVYIGLAVIWALANGETSPVEEHTRSWLALAGPRSLRKR